jgi:hypothetical protein
MHRTYVTVILNCCGIETICPQDQETDWPGEGDEEKWFRGEKNIGRRLLLNGVTSEIQAMFDKVSDEATCLL